MEEQHETWKGKCQLNCQPYLIKKKNAFFFMKPRTSVNTCFKNQFNLMTDLLFFLKPRHFYTCFRNQLIKKRPCSSVTCKW